MMRDEWFLAIILAVGNLGTAWVYRAHAPVLAWACLVAGACVGVIAERAVKRAAARMRATPASDVAHGGPADA